MSFLTRQSGDSVFTPITTAQGEPLIEVENLHTYYDERKYLPSTPVKAVNGVSFDVRRGETLGLVGESGCGKTTLGRTLAGFESASAGSVRFDGQNITELDGEAERHWPRHCQMVFQDPDSSLNERMTVGEIIEEPLDVHDWQDAAARERRGKNLLERVGLQPEQYYRYPHQFSGGQRQRIAIARALALEPEFLILDEPVSALDVSVQAQILSLLRDLQAEFDLTYLLIAHDLAVVRNICDRVAVMYLGTIMELGPTDAIFEDPANPYTRSLLSSIPEPDPAINWDPPSLRGSPPNPRYPPDGCPFTTRCPEKVRPNEWDLGDAVWEKIDALQDVLRDQALADGPVARHLRRVVGETPGSDIDPVYEELFGEVQPPDDAVAVLDRIQATHRREGPRVALDRLVETFGSDCDTDPPVMVSQESGQRSRCHRHELASEER